MRKKRSGPFIAEHLAEQRKMRRMGKLSDEEFLAVLKKHGLDPLTGKRSDKLVSPEHRIRELIAKRGRGEKLRALEVGQWLAVIKRRHKASGERDAEGNLADVPIPFLSIDVIGEVVMGRTNWQREQARKRKGQKLAAHHAACKKTSRRNRVSKAVVHRLRQSKTN